MMKTMIIRTQQVIAQINPMLILNEVNQGSMRDQINFQSTKSLQGLHLVCIRGSAHQAITIQGQPGVKMLPLHPLV
jgi:hypothetical protein